MRALYKGEEWVWVGDVITAGKSEELHNEVWDLMMSKVVKENPNTPLKIAEVPSDFEIGLTRPLMKQINQRQRIVCRAAYCSSHFSDKIQKKSMSDGGKTFYDLCDDAATTGYKAWVRKARAIKLFTT